MVEAGKATSWGREQAPLKAAWIWPLVLATLAFFFHGLYFKAGLKNLVDLGVMAVDSERILSGQVFGRDFIAPYGPGRYYLLAALFGILGPSMTVLCSVFLVLRIWVDVGAFLLARRLLPLFPSLCVFSCVALAHGPTHKGFLTAWLVLLPLAATSALGRPTLFRFFLLGAALGMAGAFRYDLGVLGLILGGITLLWGPVSRDQALGKFKRWGAFLAGALLLSLPLLLLLALGDPARLFSFELLRASLLKGATAAVPGLGAALLEGKGTAGAGLSLLLLIAPPGVFLAFLLRRTPPGPSTARFDRLSWILIAVTGMLMFSQYAIESKINRLLQVGPPLFLCLFCAAHGIAGRWLPAKTKWLLPAALLGVVGWYVHSESGRGSLDSVAVLRQAGIRLEGERAGFTTGPRLAEDLRTTLAWMERNLGEDGFYAGPTLPLLYFLAGKGNPTPITDFSYLLRNRAAQEWVLDSLRDRDIKYYLHAAAFVQGFDPEKEAPLLFGALRRDYPTRRPLSSRYSLFLRR
jgi:hypothetical protein